VRLWKHTQHNKRPGLIPAVAASTVVEENLTDLKLMLDYSPSLAHRYPQQNPGDSACQASARSDGQHKTMKLTLIIHAVIAVIPRHSRVWILELDPISAARLNDSNRIGCGERIF
jgi:hypothetical protein